MAEDQKTHISIIIPAYNEAAALGRVLDGIIALSLEAEIIVVNDGSTDETSEVARARQGVRVIDHPYNIGLGGAIKTGLRAARGEIVVLMDGDGQHRPEDIPRLAAQTERYDMVVGARTAESKTQRHRDFANLLYNAMASYLAGSPVDDLTSGFRAFRAPIARRFTYLLPNGFSAASTITIAFFRAGHTVRYEPIIALEREGRSKIKLFRDGAGFLLTLLRIGTLFAPLRIFLPVSIASFCLGAGYGAYMLIFYHRFTNMATLLIMSGIFLFMLGLISEQIAMLRLMGPVGADHRDHENHE